MNRSNWLKQLFGFVLVAAIIWSLAPDVWRTLGMQPHWHALKLLTLAYPLCAALLYALPWLLGKKGKP